jgi:hypothetical protein
MNPKHVCSTPLMLLNWWLGAQMVDTSDQRLIHLPGYCCTELPKACNYEWDLWLSLSSESSGLAPPGVTCYCQHLFCRTHFISPWTPSTLVVAAARNPDSNPLGARHRCLQLRWWPLPDLPPAPPRGPAIDVFNSGGGRCQTCHQQPLGGPPSTSPTPIVAAAGPTDSTP